MRWGSAAEIIQRLASLSSEDKLAKLDQNQAPWSEFTRRRMPRPALLSCEGLTKSFGGPPLFDGLTFAVHEGDHLGLIGPNGAGKSTLLRILAGLESPDAGTRSHRKNIRIGFVPQTPVFAPGRTAEEIVVEALIADQRLDDAERHQRAQQALARAGFTDPGVSTDVLSGGWRARD